MVEYGNTVGRGSGASGSGTGSPVDVGADVTSFVSNAVDRVAALPPEALLLLAVVILGGLLVLKRGL
jgi:hypothetical protein